MVVSASQASTTAGNAIQTKNSKNTSCLCGRLWLSYLAHADVHERLGGGVGDLQKLHDGRPVVADGHLPPVEDELVHTAGSQGRPDGVGHRLASIDVADELGLALCYIIG